MTSTDFGPWFPARYDGAGDDIRSDGSGGWLAECCGDDGDE